MYIRAPKGDKRTMRSVFTASMILALALMGAVAYATPSMDDGLSYNGANGASGYFDGVATRAGTPAGTYPNLLTSPTSLGWSAQDSPLVTYVSTKGGFSLSGIYDYDDLTWITTGGPSGESMSLKVICDVEQWVRETLSANEVYFHLGNEDAHVMNAYLSGSMASNNGQYVGLAKTGWLVGDRPDADVLKFVADGFGRTKASFSGAFVPTDIPIAYALDQGSGFVAGNWSPGNGDEYGYWWLIGSGLPGTYSYTFRLQITPKSLQEDGRYYLDPDVVVMPAL